MKKVLAILLALTMALSLCSTAWATDGVVETEGEANAPVVQESGGGGSVQTTNKITAATTSIGSGTYTLDGNVTLSGTGSFAVEDNAAAVIDLEGNTLHTGAMQIQVGEGATLTVKAGEGGQIVLDKYGIMIYGLLKLESGTIHALTNSDVVFLMGVGSFEMNGGTLLADAGACIDASYGGGKSTITINNGLIETKDTTVNAIYVASRFGVGSVEAVVNGGTIKTGKQAVIACDDAKSTVTVNGGIFDTDVSAFAAGAVAKVTAKDSVNSVFVAGSAYIQQAASVANAGDTLEVTKGSVSLTGVASGVTVSVADGASATVNNTAVPAGKSYTVGTVNAAKVGDVEYATLADAIAAAEGKTVTLLQNVTLNDSIHITKSMTIDMNGKTITVTGDKTALVVKAGKTVITGNGTFTGTAVSTARGILSVWETGELVFENGTIKAEGKYYGITAFDTGKLEIKGGTITAAYNAAVSTNGSADGENFSNGTTLKISGGTLTGGDVGVYVPAGTFEISGGVINGATGVAAKGGKLTITGGTINGTGAKENFAHNGNGWNNTGDGLAIESCDYPYSPTTISITGGTFTSKNAKAVAAYATGNYTAAAGFITGGIFDSDVSGLVASTASVVELNGKYYVGETAIKEAAKIAKSGDTITVIQGDVTLTGVVRGVTVKNGGTGTVKVNGTTVKAGKSYKVSRTTSSTTGTKTDTKKDDGKKDVKSATTFDAGIALYVGMSILSLTGTAAVIGKKKEF